VLITGANSGIGFEAAVRIARMGAHLVMVARDRQKAETAIVAARERSGSDKFSLMLCDMSSMSGVRRLAADVLATIPRLDVLVNNAGSVNDARHVTGEGLERTFAANYAGHFLLTQLLLPLLKASAPSRIVNVSSIGHRQGTLDFDNLQFEKGGFSIMKAYGRSKLAQIVFTRELARRLAGTGVTVNSLHPGAVATRIWSHAPWFTRPVLAVAQLFMLTPEQGAERIVYLAASPEVEGQTGGYYDKNKRVEPSALARDEAIAARLWEESVRLTQPVTPEHPI
jgi:NAD(P)-dependent dehydrogenase (short-subunit alcohol dehydrogenase family)